MDKIFKDSYLLNRYPEQIELLEATDKNLKLALDKEILKEAATFFKDAGYSFLADISSADYKEYFEVVYQLFSFSKDESISLKVKLEERENPQIDSLVSLWHTADWHEREVYDLMGIEFIGHPDLRRILMWEGFKGHPLRKDFAPVDRKRSWEGK